MKQLGMTELYYYQLAPLCLFDIWFYIDDSKAMSKSHGTGTKFQSVQTMMKVLVELNPSSKPFRLKFMNYHDQIFEDSLENHGVNLNNVHTKNELDGIFKNVNCTGGSPLAEKLYDRVILREIISKPLLKNPVLIIVFTSGESSNDTMTLEEVTGKVRSYLRKKKLPQRSVCYQFVVLDSEKQWKQQMSDTLFGQQLLSMNNSFGCSINFWSSSSSNFFFVSNGIKLFMSPFDIKGESEV
ncbi:unnamed protein product [Ambrosiozyma monospora]|uniref:Unnamed protein product n=1 Tax=Ambrosiozyma monospora TaxID=43982 RepID=A0A9W7DI71_AMBMO|nr:unnamed protein product [Ambrosiozyma monospora]